MKTTPVTVAIDQGRLEDAVDLIRNAVGATDAEGALADYTVTRAFVRAMWEDLTQRRRTTDLLKFVKKMCDEIGTKAAIEVLQKEINRLNTF